MSAPQHELQHVGTAAPEHCDASLERFRREIRYFNYITTMRAYLGEFEQLLLLAVMHLDDDAYGARIRQTIERRTGRIVSPGAVYTALDRLERRKLVTSWLGEPTAERGGKRKRHYRLEPSGRVLLRRSQEALGRMARGLKPKLEMS
jgi:DNA-binding PadR family transcriptional regulator